MTVTTKPFLALAATDLMSRDVITIPEGSSLRAAAELLFQNQISGGPVVDAEGRCIGVLSAADFMHWAREGGQGAADVPLPACPFQVKGRLLTGEEAVICTLAEGRCPLQKLRATTGGRHTLLCQLEPNAISQHWQQATRKLPAGTVRNYMTVDVVTVAPHTPLTTLAQKMINAHIHRVFVVDEQRRPIGIVTSTDLIAALAHAKPEGATAADYTCRGPV